MRGEQVLLGLDIFQHCPHPELLMAAGKAQRLLGSADVETRVADASRPITRL
jgi:hypothetical protein